MKHGDTITHRGIDITKDTTRVAQYAVLEPRPVAWNAVQGDIRLAHARFERFSDAVKAARKLAAKLEPKSV